MSEFSEREERLIARMIRLRRAGEEAARRFEAERSEPTLPQASVDLVVARLEEVANLLKKWDDLLFNHPCGAGGVDALDRLDDVVGAVHGSSPSVGSPESSAPGVVVGASEPTEGDLSHVAVSSEQLAVRKEVAILVNRAKRLLARAWHAGSPSMTEDPELARLLGGPLYSAESCLWRASAALNHLVGFADADVIASDLGVDE